MPGQKQKLYIFLAPNLLGLTAAIKAYYALLLAVF
jgi:hypothetical protein